LALTERKKERKKEEMGDGKTKGSPGKLLEEAWAHLAGRLKQFPIIGPEEEQRS
jgi:hypothetical protein